MGKGLGFFITFQSHGLRSLGKHLAFKLITVLNRIFKTTVNLIILQERTGKLLATFLYEPTTDTLFFFS